MDIELKTINAGSNIEQQTNNKQTKWQVTSVASGIDFHNMIDHCLLEIFSFEWLTVMDFCSIAETCVRFRQTVKCLIPKNISIFNEGKGDCTVRWQHLSRNYTESEVERIFKNFGSTISRLSLSNFEVTHLLIPILDNCNNNLKKLQIYDSLIPEITAVKFTQLKILRLENVDIAPNASFTALISLVELKVARVRNSKAILLNNFPNLKYFTYIGNIRSTRVLLHTRLFGRLSFSLTDRPGSTKVLSTFFRMNKTLKTIDLILDDFVRKDKIVLKAIVKSCKKLDVLRVNCGGVSYTDLIQPMKSKEPLGYIELSRASCADLAIFSSLTAFRTLCLYCCNLPTPGQFASLTHITKLELDAFQSPNMLDVVGIIGQLVNLEVLNINLLSVWIEPPFVLDENTFAKIVAVVKERDNVLTLRCRTEFNPREFIRDENVRLIRLHP